MTKAPLGGEDTGSNPTDRRTRSAHRHDMKLVRETLEHIVVDRPAPTEAQPQEICLDKGYDYQVVRDTVKEFDFTAHIRRVARKPKP